jgi:hypothetical protein
MEQKLEAGSIVATDRRGDRNTGFPVVMGGGSDIIQDADFQAGFRLAEFRRTGYRVFVLLAEDDRFSVRNWGGSFARTVRFFDVETVVEASSGSIMAGVGAERPNGMVRLDALGWA